MWGWGLEVSISVRLFVRVPVAVFVFGTAIIYHPLRAGAQGPAPQTPNSSTSLPSITVNSPQQRRTPALARSQQRASRSGRRVRAAQRNPNAVPAPAAQGSPVGERLDGHVNGYVANATGTGSKTNTPIRELPQTVNVVTADQIRDQGAQTVSQALRYVPGVLTESYGGASQFDAYTQIRGFQADSYLDSQRLPNGISSTFWASTVIEPYGLEQIEVLKGPSSVLYGQSTLGGIINMTSKRPTAVPFGEVALQTGSFDRAQVAFDIGGPTDPSGQFLYRLTGLVRDAGTQVDFIQNNRAFIAPAFTWRPTNDTTLTLLASYQSGWGGRTGFNYLPTSGTLTFNPNGRLPRNLYVGDPTFDHFSRQQGSVGYLFEHRFNDVLTVRQNVRYFEVDADLKALNRFGELQADQQTLNRRAFGIDAGAKSVALDNQAEVRFLTGPFSHRVLLGVDYRVEDSHYNIGSALAPAINVYHPVYGMAITDPGTTNFQLSSTNESQLGGYVQDQIKFGSWVATIGGRYDIADADTLNGKTGFVGRQRDSAFTGRVGLNYLFDNGITPYIGYSTAFQPQPGVDINNNVYKPSTGEQVEAGIKYQPPGTRTLITLSVFDIRQQNRLTADMLNLGRFIQTAGARVRGVEIESKIEVTPGFNVIASYAHLDHEVTASTNPAEIGRRLAQTPNDQAAVWALYEFQGGDLRGFGLGGGVRYVGQTYDITNATVTPGYTLFDARIQYELGNLSPQLKGASLSVNGFNLFDKYYLTQCTTGAGCTLGFGRTVLASLIYKW